MQSYIVKINSIHGELEDFITHLVQATDIYLAGTQAIENQAFGELSWEDSDKQSATCLYGDIYLSVYDTKPVLKKHYAVLKKYL